MRRLWCILLLALSAQMAVAQSFPSHRSTTVNDFAGLLTVPQEARLNTALTDLRRDTGVEMTVVTLRTQTAYAPNVPMEQFATDLFNHWGVGNATHNDGIMVLVAHDDRAMRIELGAGYGRTWDRTAQRIIDDMFLPRFREGAFGPGIVAGSLAVITDIARPAHAGAPPEFPPLSDGLQGFVVIGVMLAFVLFTQAQKIVDLLGRLRRCPRCGSRGSLRVTRRTVMMATTTSPGQVEKTVTCSVCDYRDVSAYRTSRISSQKSSGRSSFGGGRSGGGGASGRW